MADDRDDRALLRALRIERAAGKLYRRKLSEMMGKRAYMEFLEFCRATTCSRDATDVAAEATAEAGDG